MFSHNMQKSVNKQLKTPLFTEYPQIRVQSPPPPPCRFWTIPCKAAERQWEWAKREVVKKGRLNANVRKSSQNEQNVLPNVYPCFPRSP